MKINKIYSLVFLAIILAIWAPEIKSVTYLFSHGSFDTGKQVQTYMKEYEILPGEKKTNKFYIIDNDNNTGNKVKSFNYPDANMFCRFLQYIYKTSLGQENELQVLKKAFDEIKDKEDEIVLIGLSRGASALVNFVVTLDQKDTEKIKAIVLISPFAHAHDIFERNIFFEFLYWVFKQISKYNESGPHPIDCIGKISKAIPVLFACSKMDKTVPCKSTIKLYKKLLESGHPEAFLTCLNTGSHAKFLQSPDAQNFQNVVHGFYKKHKLPHNQEFSKLGEPLLKECNPDEKACDLMLESNVYNAPGFLDSAVDSAIESIAWVTGGIKNMFVSVYSYCKSFLN